MSIIRIMPGADGELIGKIINYRLDGNLRKRITENKRQFQKQYDSQYWYVNHLYGYDLIQRHELHKYSCVEDSDEKTYVVELANGSTVSYHSLHSCIMRFNNRMLSSRAISAVNFTFIK